MDAKSKMGADGHYVVECFRDGKLIWTEDACNLVVDEGLMHILDVTLNAATQITAWYLGMFETNYTPAADDDAGNIVARSVETTAYTEGTRPLFNSSAAASNAVTNSANRAVFTINATKTMYGIFLVSNSAKQAGLGTLLSVAKFTNARSVISGDELRVTYTLTAQDV